MMVFIVVFVFEEFWCWENLFLEVEVVEVDVIDL